METFLYIIPQGFQIVAVEQVGHGMVIDHTDFAMALV